MRNQILGIAAIASLNMIALNIAEPAAAQWWQSRRNTPETRGYNTHIDAVTGQTISREQFNNIHALSGGVDQDGRYRNPMSAINLYGVNPGNVWIRHPMAWEPQNSVIYRVENGYIVEQDYILVEW